MFYLPVLRDVLFTCSEGCSMVYLLVLKDVLRYIHLF